MPPSTGFANSALGDGALYSNAAGSNNVAVGYSALERETANNNVAIGSFALVAQTSGNWNIGLGTNAGLNLRTGTANIDIGSEGAESDSGMIRIGATSSTYGLPQNATFIAGISGSTVSGSAVHVTSDGELGVLTSSRKFKNNIQKMDGSSDVLLSLQPVTYRYKPQVEPSGMPQFGLVAEDVEKVDPDLVIHDKQGKPFTVRYEAVNAMLLNEFLKEHKTVESQQATMQAQSMRLQSVDARLQSQADALAVQQKELGLLKAQISATRSARD